MRDHSRPTPGRFGCRPGGIEDGVRSAWVLRIGEAERQLQADHACVRERQYYFVEES
jgi:hypothetical protein